MRRILLLALFLVSELAIADEIKSIRIFHSDTVSVSKDAPIPEGVVVYSHNMDSLENSEKKLTNLLKKKVEASKRKSSVEAAYSQAFSELMNSPAWKQQYQEIIDSTEAQQKAVTYGIKKIPAVLFNDKSIVYGVTSLNEAIAIFNSKGGL